MFLSTVLNPYRAIEANQGFTSRAGSTLLRK